jgi:hypothetical protein
MRRPKENTRLYNFLASVGLQDDSPVEQIIAAKKQYRKTYLLEHKQKHRKANPEFLVQLSKENGEYETITESAKKHSMPVSVFLKKSTIAYINQFYVVPNRVQLAKMEQLLSQCLNEIQTIVKSKERFFWEREQKFEAIEMRIIKLESEIKEVICNPPLKQNDSQTQVSQKVL